jgi:hypothetical protein
MPRKSNYASPIRYVREAAGLAAPAFARLFRISRFHLQDLELGTRPVTDGLATAISLCWDLDPDSLKGQRAAPKFSNGHQITKPSNAPEVQDYFHTYPTSRYDQFNHVAGVAFDKHLLPRLERVIKAAAARNQAPLIYEELRRWIVGEEIVFGLAPEPPARNHPAEAKPTQVSSVHNADVVRGELAEHAPPDEFETDILNLMKRKISRSLNRPRI